MLPSGRQSTTEEARQMVDSPEVVAHVDIGTQVAGAPVDDKCQVQRVDAPSPLNGLWDVASVRYTPALLRLILRRPEALRGRV